MDFNEFKEEFLIACDFIDVPEVDETTKFIDIEDFDSLAMLGVIVLLETKFSKHITGEQVMNLETLANLHKFAGA
jgi:acyl carrier protein